MADFHPADEFIKHLLALPSNLLRYEVFGEERRQLLRQTLCLWPENEEELIYDAANLIQTLRFKYFQMFNLAFFTESQTIFLIEDMESIVSRFNAHPVVEFLSEHSVIDFPRLRAVTRRVALPCDEHCRFLDVMQDFPDSSALPTSPGVKRPAPKDSDSESDSPVKRRAVVNLAPISDSIFERLADPWNISGEEKGYFLYWVVQRFCNDDFVLEYDGFETTIHNVFQAKFGTLLERVFDVERSFKLSDIAFAKKGPKRRAQRLFVPCDKVLDVVSCLIHIKHALAPANAELVSRLVEATQ